MIRNNVSSSIECFNKREYSLMAGPHQMEKNYLLSVNPFMDHIRQQSWRAKKVVRDKHINLSWLSFDSYFFLMLMLKALLSFLHYHIKHSTSLSSASFQANIGLDGYSHSAEELAKRKFSDRFVSHRNESYCLC